MPPPTLVIRRIVLGSKSDLPTGVQTQHHDATNDLFGRCISNLSCAS